MKVVYNSDIEKIEIEVKQTIGLAETIALVTSVAEGCFDDEGNYNPYFFDFAFMRGILQCYTNLEVGDDYNKTYDMIYAGSLMDDIIECINPNQFHAIKRAIFETIDDRKETRYELLKQEIEKAVIICKQASQQINEIGLMAERLSNGDLQELMKRLNVSTENTKEFISEYKKATAVAEKEDNSKVIPFPDKK